MDKDTITIKKSLLREWFETLVSVRENGDETKALHDLMDLETQILNEWREHKIIKV